MWRARWVGDRGSPPADVPHDNRKELAGSDAIGLDPTFHGFTVPAGIQTVDRRAVHYMLIKMVIEISFQAGCFGRRRMGDIRAG